MAAASMLLQLGSCSVSVGRRRSRRTNGSRNARQGVLAMSFKSMKKEVQTWLRKTEEDETKGTSERGQSESESESESDIEVAVAIDVARSARLLLALLACLLACSLQNSPR